MASESPASASATSAPYPARSRTASGLISSVPTDVSVISLADKILITIVQDGRLSQWVHVPLDTGDETGALSYEGFEEQQEDDELLPLTALTPTTLLGGADAAREATGQLVAVQIASAIKKREKEEKRLCVVGLGLGEKELERGGFVDLLLLVGGLL